MPLLATIDRVYPAVGLFQELRITWEDEGLKLEAEDFDLTPLGEIERIENNPNGPGRADISIVGECRLPKGSKLPLRQRPKA